jgi:hypothetical protein
VVAALGTARSDPQKSLVFTEIGPFQHPAFERSDPQRRVRVHHVSDNAFVCSRRCVVASVSWRRKRSSNGIGSCSIALQDDQAPSDGSSAAISHHYPCRPRSTGLERRVIKREADEALAPNSSSHRFPFWGPFEICAALVSTYH